MTMDFGVIVPQGWHMELAGLAPAEAYNTMSRVAQEAEALGYNSAWVYDHFLTIPYPSQNTVFECWTSTAALARDTKTIRIGQIVTCNSYRNPSLLAKMASTVDSLSNGRLNFGIGAGWYEKEYNAYGYPYPRAGVRLAQLGEAVQVILAMWTQENPTFEGKYYQIHDAISQPKGVQKPHIPLLIGGGGEKVTLKLVAQYADASNFGGDISVVKHKLEVLKQHCEAVGRDFNTIRRTSSADIIIAETEQEVLAKLSPEQRSNLENVRKQMLVGTPDQINERLAQYEQAGIQEMILYFPDARNLESVRLFAKECMKKPQAANQRQTQ